VPNEHIEDPATDLEARRAELLPIVVQQISEQDDRRRRRQDVEARIQAGAATTAVRDSVSSHELFVVIWQWASETI
jgi:hypothetical protein